MTFWIGLAILALPLIVGGYFLFRDSMNLFQKVGRVYWITRNNMKRPQPFISRAFLVHDSPPYWIGKGVQIAWKWGEVHEVDVADNNFSHPRQFSFQIGWLSKASTFNPDLYVRDSRIRDWRRPKR